MQQRNSQTAPLSRPIRSDAVLRAVMVTALSCLLMGTACVNASTTTDEPAAPPVALAKVGEARLKFMFWSVYDSRLYTTSGQYSEGERPLKLEIQYLLDIKADDLLKRTFMEWNDMGRTHPRHEQWRSELANIWTDIESGDTLTLELDASNRSTFRHNGEILGHVEDPEFGQQFVDIWLSEDCTRPEIRQSLLGQKAS